MKISTQLSVSSVVLAAMMSGCSQQMAGGSQMAGSSQSQIEGAAQAGSQQQVQKTAPVVAPVYKPAPVKRTVVKAKPTVKKYTRKSSIGLPPAKPGQCFAKVKQPARYINKQRKVLVRKATSKRVLVRGPQYTWVNKRVLARKAAYKTRTIPAQYRTITKKVLVKPAHFKWEKKAHGKVMRIDHMTGEVLCRVKVPAVYKNVTQRVVARPARTVRTLVPAVYKNIKVKKLVSPAIYKTVKTPAHYKTVNYRVKVGEARYVWRQTMCKSRAKTLTRMAHRKPSKSYSKSGISLSDYYAVMNAKVPAKVTAKPVRKKAKKVQKVAEPIKEEPQTTTLPEAGEAEKAAPEVMKEETAPATTTETTEAETKQESAEAAAVTDETSEKQVSKKKIIIGIQKALKEKGFDPGPIDGKMGPGTAAALKAFQSSRGLPVGRLTKDTFRALGLIR